MKKKRIVALLKTTMRISIIQLVLAAGFTCSALAGNVEAQILDKPISISLYQTRMEQVLLQIQKMTEVKFVYSPSIVEIEKKISLNVTNRKLSAVLDEILKPSAIQYKLINDYILLYRNPLVPAEELAPAKEEPGNHSSIDENEWKLLQFTIKGRVTDDTNEALPGVSILLKGTILGTTTDANGEYSLSVPDDMASTGVLVVSFIGYTKQEIAIGSQTTVNVQLASDITSLGEVVVVGFGEQRKISVVGANSEVTVDELKQPVANIGTMLAGRVAGVVQVQRSGEPGRDGANIWIRGISSWPSYGGVSPLILIDGVERSLDNIDPEDVESFNILKDASATAVYGMRGANGVILIKTKTGKIGKTKVDFNYSQGVTSFTRVPDLADGPTFMRLTNEALTTRGDAPKFSQEQIDGTVLGEDPYVYPNVDWYDAVFNKTARNRKINLNAHGGNDRATYYISLGYYNEEGFFKTEGLEQYNSKTSFTRYNFTSNLDFELSRTTKLLLGVQGYISEANYPGEMSEDVFQQIMYTSPVAYPTMYPGGLVPGRETNGDFRNPYADITQRGYRNNFRNQVFSNVRLVQDLKAILPGLSFTTMFSFDAWNRHDIERKKRKDTYFVDPNDPRNPDGSLNLNLTYTSNNNTLAYNRITAGNRRYYTESALNYSRTFDKHVVTGMLLYNQSDYTNVVPTDSDDDNFTNSIPYRTRGLAGRITYSFMDRYFLELNGGYNGSENFAPSRRFGFFPSYAVGWLMSEEAFFEPIRNAIPFLKFRFSDGLVGISGGGRRFGYLTILDNDDKPGYTYGKPGNSNGVGGIEIQDYGVDVGWAKARKTNLGIDIRTWEEKVSLTVDLWKEHRTDIFLQRGVVPDYIGLYNLPWGNLGAVDNKGIDIALSIKGIALGQTTWSLRGNFNYNRDEVIENDQPKQPYSWLEKRGSNVLAYWGFQAEGLFESQEDIDNHAVQTFGPVQPGDIKYKDMNGDNLINNLDQVKIGIGDVPRITYGVGFNMLWKSFDAGAFFQGTARADRAINGMGVMPFSGGAGAGNVYALATDRWTEENPSQDVTYPRLAYGTEYSNNIQASSWWVRDMSFMRLKTAEIGYTLRSEMLRSVGITHTRFYVMGVNLLTFSKFKMWDPELNTGNGTTYPNVRTISVGVNISF
jgi:TonB-linked SusC/RagA family outer membrane protein